MTVRIVERTPVGAVAVGGGYVVVDAAGVQLSESATMPAGQPLMEVSGGTDSTVFAAAGYVMRALPEALRAQVTSVVASTPDDVTLNLASGTSIVWGNADRSAYKAQILETLLVSAPGMARYDLSTPDVPAVQ
jgi:cell division protein FtsQ